MTDIDETQTEDHVRNLHEFTLNTHMRLGMRIGRAPTPARMWAYAAGTGAAWAAHRLLERLAVVDPDGVQAFAAELAEEGEFPEMTDPYGAAAGMGFPVQEWVDAEYKRRDAKHEAITLLSGTQECMDRECEEYSTPDGADDAGVERCSHIREEQVCRDCSVQNDDGTWGYTFPAPCPDGPITKES